ncbi:MAG: hypothetical protein M9958_02680 [Chitinophagales bacterium]|nr:hypothetical protein [Chitinophagales bacterium]
MKNTYIFTPEAKGFLIKGFIVGLILLAIGIAMNWNAGVGGGDHHGHAATLRTHLIANIYTVVLYGFWIGVTALFFLSATTLALGGWHIQIQKVLLAIGGTLPFSILLLAIFFAVFNHDLFHWTHDLYDPNSATYDAILASKRDYLNMGRFWVFAIAIFVLVLGLYFLWNKNLNEMDTNPSVKLFDKSRAIAAASIFILAMLVNTFGSWDWAMSIQPHWYSTMFSWYLMASAAVGMFSILFIIVFYLKKNDYLPHVNENHQHDVAKYMFAISIFWTYVWFSQFMLIWYANIPEETIYFTKRLHGYAFMFYISLALNFILPFLALMKRDSKRKSKLVLTIAVFIIIGHWFDFFNMIVPELIEGGGGFNLISVGAFVALASVFIYIALTTLSKYKDLSSSTHPYIKESYGHHI